MTDATSAGGYAGKLAEARRFDLFVRTHRRPLIAYYRRRGAAPGDIEDLVQDVFLRLLRKLQDGEEIAQSYVFAAASSVWIDHHRHAAVRTGTGQHGPLAEDLRCSAPEPDRIVEGRDDLRVIRKRILELPPKWRRAFLFHRFDDMSHTEIARKMDVSVSSVEKYIINALARLKAGDAGPSE